MNILRKNIKILISINSKVKKINTTINLVIKTKILIKINYKNKKILIIMILVKIIKTNNKNNFHIK